jgi:hypothetical protein
MNERRGVYGLMSEGRVAAPRLSVNKAKKED